LLVESGTLCERTYHETASRINADIYIRVEDLYSNVALSII